MGNISVKTICLLSSAGFSAATCICPWMAPVGAAFGLASGLMDNNEEDLSNRLISAIHVALENTRAIVNTTSQEKIVDELLECEVNLDNLDDMIKKTEAYRQRYCTNRDATIIIQSFDWYLRQEIAKHPYLSAWFSLTAGNVTLERLEAINKTLLGQETKLDNISQDVKNGSNTTNEILNLWQKVLNEVTYILVAMAGCLAVAAILKGGNPFFYAYALLSYVFSSLCTYYLVKSNNRAIVCLKSSIRKSKIIIGYIANFLLQLLTPVGCFLIILSASGANEGENVVAGALSVAIGSVLCFILKKTGEIVSQDQAITP